MNIKNSIKNLHNFFTSTRGTSSEQVIRNQFNEAFLYAAGGHYTEYDQSRITYLEKGYNINPIVYSIVNQQAVKTASIPFYIKTVKDKVAKAKIDAIYKATGNNPSVQQQVKIAVLSAKAFEDKGDLPFPMEAPNATQSWSEFMALYKTFLKLTGNAYIYMLSPEDGMNAGMPLQVYLLPSHMVQITVKDKASMLGSESPVSGYILTEGRSFIQFEEKDVIHIKYSNPNYSQAGEHLYGQSPLRAALKNLQSSNTSLDLNIKTLKSGGAFGFFFAKNNVALTKDQATAFKESLMEMDASPDNLSKIAGSSVELGFQRMSLTSDELKPFDYLKFDQKQIANVLNWSDLLLNNDDGAKYDNLTVIERRVVTSDIVPDLKLFTEAINKKFLPRFKGYDNTCIFFDVMELPEMQTDIKELSEWLNNALDRGVLSRNEYRIAIRYSVSEDSNMDIMTVQNDIMSLEESLDNSFGVIE
jgi:HK97 family phage portal protein